MKIPISQMEAALLFTAIEKTRSTVDSNDPNTECVRSPEQEAELNRIQRELRSGVTELVLNARARRFCQKRPE